MPKRRRRRKPTRSAVAGTTPARPRPPAPLAPRQSAQQLVVARTAPDDADGPTGSQHPPAVDRHPSTRERDRSRTAAAAEPVGQLELAPAARPWLVPRRTARLSVSRSGWAGLLADRRPQVLAATYWLDARSVVDGVTHVQFTAVQPGSVPRSATRAVRVPQRDGPICVVGVIPHVDPGTWSVTARPIADVDSAQQIATGTIDDAPPQTTSGTPLFGPLATMRSPGVVFGAWPLAVLLGFLTAIGVQATMSVALDLPIGRLALGSVIASLLGLGGAKAYFALTHRARARPEVVSQGLSVQGFVLVSLLALASLARLAELPLGVVLDAAAPALLAGQAVGRLGCLLSGCCVGRPTASRWGVWSSDRRLGCRRIPVQLLESAAAAVIAAVAAGAVLSGLAGTGAVLIASVAANVLVRQLLFGLRQEARTVRWGRKLSSVVSLIALGTALAVLITRVA